MVELIVRPHTRLASHGLDADPDTIAWHLAQHHGTVPSPATISRHLNRAGLVAPEPGKRPRSSYIRFQAAMPNETWQSDFTHYRLVDLADVEILTWLDDCTRYALNITAHAAVTTPLVLATFQAAAESHGLPCLHAHRHRHGLHHPPLRHRQSRAGDYQPQKPQNALPKESEM